MDVAEFCRTDTVPFPSEIAELELLPPIVTPPVPVPIFVIVFSPAVNELIKAFPEKVIVLFELFEISNELANWRGAPMVVALLVDTKFSWAFDPPLFITSGVAAEAVMVNGCDWFVSPIFKIPTV